MKRNNEQVGEDVVKEEVKAFESSSRIEEKRRIDAEVNIEVKE